MYDAIKKLPVCFALLLFVCVTHAQTVSQNIAQAYSQFEKDPQLQSAIASLYVIEAGSGKTVFEKNATTGLAPASTQKIITSATAYEWLGKSFRYTTDFGFTGSKGLTGNLFIRGSGDPTLGSTRWKSTSEDSVLFRVLSAVKQAGIKNFDSLLIDTKGWEGEVIPDGWIWQDVGNYYGAGADVLNWRENQYDMILRSGDSVGSPVKIVETKPALYGFAFDSRLKAGAKGSGDNAYIYFPNNGSTGVVRGTIPISQQRFVISGALPSGKYQLAATLLDSLGKRGVIRKKGVGFVNGLSGSETLHAITIFHKEVSPVLDTMIYWFLKKSINLYGEALLRTMAFQKTGTADPSTGVKLLREFWKDKGVPVTELNMVDGSGLSPLNRVTTHAQVTILAYAQKQSWFDGYYQALPLYNGMHMKSGTINGAKSFCGYHHSTDGKDYVFSFIVNNYNGSSSTLVQKMYKVLDELK